MLTSRVEQATEIDQLLPVQLQGVDRGTADRRETDDEFERLVPREMVTSHISAGKEKWDELIGRGINGLGAVVFVIVAALTGQR